MNKSTSILKTIVVCFLMLSLKIDQVSARQTTCDCEVVFEQMTEKLEANYIGLRHFQDRAKGPEYQQRKQEYAAKAKTIPARKCAEFLQEFLDYFEDGHLYVLERPRFEGAKLDSIEAKIQSEKVETSTLLEELKRQKTDDPNDAFLGKYKDGTSEFVVLKTGEVYNAYIIKSDDENVSPGEIKVHFSQTTEGLRGTYYSYAHIPRFLKGGLYKDGTLLQVEGQVWVKTDTDKERELSMVNFEGGTDWPTIQQLDKDNVLISIPTFAIDRAIWQNVTKANEEILRNATNLIFDIRGNRGGNAIYFSVFNLFSNRKRIGGQGHVLASEDNKAYFERIDSKIYKDVVTAIGQNMGNIIDGPDYPDRLIKKHRKSKVQQVAILTDEACMSAAESFILHARASSTLVKTFGSPTDGVIDYTSVNTILLDSGDQRIYFGYPTSTLHKGIPDDGYNKTGILPDVPIDQTVEDKVAFIMDYYRKAK